MYKVSVVVPVYNVEEYIERCLVSLFEQSLDNIQFIIINDGSTDNSLDKIKVLIERYNSFLLNVVLINRENKGIAYTRNEGLERATGEYLIYVDSDDWVEPNFLEKLYQQAALQAADIVICGYNLVFRNKKIPVFVGSSMSSDELIEKILLDKVAGFTWNKLVKKSIYSKNRFKSGINYMEDVIYIIQCSMTAKKIAIVNEPLINYNQENERSITKEITEDKIKAMLHAINYISSVVQVDGKVALDSLMVMKLKRKAFILFNIESLILDKKWCLKLFPEANSYIFHSEIKTKSRIVLLAAHTGRLGFYLFKVLYAFIKKVYMWSRSG